MVHCVYPSLVEGHLDSLQVFSVISKAIRKMYKKKKRGYTLLFLLWNYLGVDFFVL